MTKDTECSKLTCELFLCVHAVIIMKKNCRNMQWRSTERGAVPGAALCVYLSTVNVTVLGTEPDSDTRACF